MSDTRTSVISLGADVGGQDAHEATHKHILIFRRLLAEICRVPYSGTVKEFALVLRIDGSIQAWGRSGVGGVKLQRRSTFATADIYLPKSVWAASNPSTLKEFLASEVKVAIAEIVELASRRGVPLLRDELERDVWAAAQRFTQS